MMLLIANRGLDVMESRTNWETVT